MIFSIIAVEVLEGTSEIHFRNLFKNKPYYLVNNFTIERNGEVESISATTIDVDLFSHGKDLKINLSAIVGKNGAGKSTLIELIIKSINNVFFDFRRNRRLYRLHKVERVENVEINLYYQIEKNKIIKLHTFDKNYKLYEYNLNVITGKFQFHKEITNEFDLNNFFYTEIINYSMYAYNSKIDGSWISQIFHKNDSYQTPIVLNPFRDEGNIDVNKENQLVFQRLLVNLLQRERDEMLIGENLYAQHLILKLAIEKKEFRYYDQKAKDEIKFSLAKFSEASRRTIVSKLISAFHKKKLDEFPLDEVILKACYAYFLFKLINICRKYDGYNYFDFKSRKFTDLTKLISKLAADNSHITFKLRQTLNYIVHRHIDFDPAHAKSTISIDVLSEEIEKLAKKGEIVKYIPPPIFEIDLDLRSKSGSPRQISFSSLSSGEKQFIYSLNSIYYHLINLDSVGSSGNSQKKRYAYVNIILEEIELYFHPDFQRKFINILVKGVNNLELNQIKAINFIFVTHSPFILSDVPSNNVLYLQLLNGKATSQLEKKKTFGANIHHILADNFFVTDGIYVGEFTHQKIKETIHFLKSKKNVSREEEIQYYYNLIKLIDEPIIKNKLLEMFAETFPSFINSVVLEIKRLKVEAYIREMGFKGEINPIIN